MSSDTIYKLEYVENAMTSRGFYSDRDVSADLKLPYSIYDIKLKPNELVSSTAINASFSKLYDNLLYIISQARVPSSFIPNKKNYTSFLAVGLPIDYIADEEGTPLWTETDDSLLTEITAAAVTSETDMYSISGLSMYNDRSFAPAIMETSVSSELSGAVNGMFIENPLDPTSVAGMILTKTTGPIDITMIQDKGSEVDVLAQTDRLDNYTNRVVTSIDKILPVGTDTYMLNTSDCVIYKYDTLGLFTRDRSYLDPEINAAGKLLVDIVGGYGSVTDGAKFSSPVTICNDISNNIYVVDIDDEQSTRITNLKKYDKNLNFQHVVDISEHIKECHVVDSIYAKNRLYILAWDRDDTTSETGYIYEFTSDGKYINRWVLREKLEVGEYYRQLVQSKDSDHVVYMATNKNIYKKFLSKLSGCIGKYDYEGRKMYIPPHGNIAFISCAKSPRGEYVYVCDSETGIIYKFDEIIDYQEMTDRSWATGFMPIHEIEISPDEYVNNIVYNKSLSKMFYNHALVGNSIMTKVICKYDKSNFIKFASNRYLLLPQEVRSRGRGPGLDTYIGINEALLSSTINRPLEVIYNFQRQIISDLKIGIIDYPPPERFDKTLTIPASGDELVWCGDRWETVTVVEDTPELAEYME
jgi:hypothetical protein